MAILVIDVGTTSVRAADRRRAAPRSRRSCAERSRRRRRSRASSSSTPRRWRRPWSRPPPRRSAAVAEPVTAVGITNQRASTVVWDRATGEPIGPALGWQDLRTVIECIMAKAEHGLALAPNQSATKVAWLLDNVAGGARSRPVLRHGRHVAGVDAVGRRAARHRPHERRRHRAARVGRVGLEPPGAATCSRVPAAMLPAIVDSQRRDRRGDGARRARRRSPRSSATSRARSSARAASAPGGPRSRSAPAACSTCAAGTSHRTRPAAARTARSRSSPGRTAAA